MAKEHGYQINVTWTGNTGVGTQDYRSYERSLVVQAPGKPDLAGSSDPAFRGMWPGGTRKSYFSLRFLLAICFGISIFAVLIKSL